MAVLCLIAIFVFHGEIFTTEVPKSTEAVVIINPMNGIPLNVTPGMVKYGLTIGIILISSLVIDSVIEKIEKSTKPKV